MNPKCYICGSDSKFLLKKDGFDEYICNRCDLSFVHPQPTAEFLKTDVYSLESGYQRNKSADLSIEKPGKRYGRVLDFIAKEKPGGNLLDVGCSTGQFMYWARQRGFNCKGVEINKRTAETARQNGFDVFNGFLHEAVFESESFDVIFLGDVIEHVNNPRSFLKDAVSFLKKDGLLVISTPNVNCVWSKCTLLLYNMFNIPWTSATPPYHLFQFSFENLNLLTSEFKLTNAKTFFLPPPSLRYELGSLHLLGKWKKEKTISSFIFMLFSYTAYTVAYILNLVIYPFHKKDFQMSAIYKR